MCVKEIRFREKLQNNHYFVCVLKELGMDVSYMGFYYMIDILDLIINRGVCTRSFSRDIYPLVAQINNTTDCTIERNIRFMIDNCWGSMKDKFYRFWPSDIQPSCCKFIDLVRNYIMTKIS